MSTPNTLIAKKDNADFNYRLKAGVFLTSITALSALVTFGLTIASAKRKDPKMFERGVTIAKGQEESGIELAARALKWGTFYSVTGCSLITFGIWKLSGANSMNEFKMKVGNLLPKIPKNEVPQGRTEFSGLNDLLNYVSNDYQKDIVNSKSS